MSDRAGRPKKLFGPTYKDHMGDCGSLFTIVNLPLEVIIKMGRSGGCLRALLETIGRLISLALQYGVPVEEIATTLKGVRCERAFPPNGGPGKAILSCPDAIAKNLERSIAPEPEVQELNKEDGPVVYRNSQSDDIA